jgi:hypothetical protein
MTTRHAKRIAPYISPGPWVKVVKPTGTYVYAPRHPGAICLIFPGHEEDGELMVKLVNRALRQISRVQRQILRGKT